MPRYPHVKTADLIALYNSGKAAGDIAAIVGMPAGNVYRRMKCAGAKRRTLKQRFPKAFPPIQKITALYLGGKSCDNIANTLGLSNMTVAKRLKRAGIKMRTAGSGLRGRFVAKKSPVWKGGRHIDDKGYVKIWVSANGDYALEHRLVMEQTLGRKLERHEHVHHLNGIRDDNRAENLELTDIHRHERGTLVKAMQRRVRELEEEIRNAHYL